MLSGKERAGLLGGAIGLALGAGAVLLGGHLWRLLRGRRLLPFETAPPHPDWKVRAASRCGGLPTTPPCG